MTINPHICAINIKRNLLHTTSLHIEDKGTKCDPSFDFLMHTQLSSIEMGLQIITQAMLLNNPQTSII